MKHVSALACLMLWAIPVLVPAAEWQVTVRTPCFEPYLEPDSLRCLPDSAAVEAALDSLEVRGLRFGDADTLLLGMVPVRGRECSEIDFTMLIAPGTMGELLLTLRDRAGHPSCGVFHYVFAFPAVDSAVIAAVEPHYRLVLNPPGAK